MKKLIWVLILSFGTIYYFPDWNYYQGLQHIISFWGWFMHFYLLAKPLSRYWKYCTITFGLCDIMAGLFDAASLFFNKLTYLLLTGITIVTIQFIITNEETSCWWWNWLYAMPARQWMGILVWGLRSLSNNKVDYCICKQTSQNLGELLQQRVRLIVCWNLQCYNNLESAKSWWIIMQFC